MPAAATAPLGHVAGAPIEEVVPLLLAAGATASVGVRLAWHRLRSATGSRGRDRLASNQSRPRS